MWDITREKAHVVEVVSYLSLFFLNGARGGFGLFIFCASLRSFLRFLGTRMGHVRKKRDAGEVVRGSRGVGGHVVFVSLPLSLFVF